MVVIEVVKQAITSLVINALKPEDATHAGLEFGPVELTVAVEIILFEEPDDELDLVAQLPPELLDPGADRLCGRVSRPRRRCAILACLSICISECFRGRRGRWKWGRSMRHLQHG
jgi:hypothetical protein